MNSIDIAMNFGNVVNLFAVLFLTKAIIKDRNFLRGFSVSGTLLTTIAISGFEVGFFLMGNFFSFTLGLVTLIFWIMTFIFALRNMKNKSKN